MGSLLDLLRRLLNPEGVSPSAWVGQMTMFSTTVAVGMGILGIFTFPYNWLGFLTYAYFVNRGAEEM